MEESLHRDQGQMAAMLDNIFEFCAWFFYINSNFTALIIAHKGQNNNNLAMVQIMAGYNPFFETPMVSLTDVHVRHSAPIC